MQENKIFTAKDLMEDLTSMQVLGPVNQPTEDKRIPTVIGGIQKRPDMTSSSTKKERKKYYKRRSKQKTMFGESTNELKKVLIQKRKDQGGETVKIYKVDGDRIRYDHISKFQKYGHPYIDKEFGIIGQDEIWLDKNLNKEELNFQYFRANAERNLVLYHGMNPLDAQITASKQELDYRQKKAKLNNGK